MVLTIVKAASVVFLNALLFVFVCLFTYSHTEYAFWIKILQDLQQFIFTGLAALSTLPNNGSKTAEVKQTGLIAWLTCSRVVAF